jgi:CheY-like chemotaxis protein
MTKPVVLIVEDDGRLAIHLEGMLNRLGYEVAGLIASGEEAVAFVMERKVDLVLMDIEPAGSMNGVIAAPCGYLIKTGAGAGTDGHHRHGPAPAFP